MIRGLYSAAAGLLSTNVEEGVVADNLANVQTAGYKARNAVLATFDTMAVSRVQPFAAALGAAAGTTVTPLAALPSGALVNETAVDWTEGPLQQSNSPLAVAIDGPGFFAVSTPQGTEYTRGGDFRFNAQGVLTNPVGAPVLGANGAPITVPGGQSGAPVTIDPSGQVLTGGRAVATIGVFAPPTNALSPVGGGLYALAAGTPAPGPQPGAVLRPGFIEGSNVDLVGEMSALMQMQQAFASDAQAVQANATAMQTAATQVGSVA